MFELQLLSTISAETYRIVFHDKTRRSKRHWNGKLALEASRFISKTFSTHNNAAFTDNDITS